MTARATAPDPLDVACLRIWREIQRLLVEQTALRARNDTRDGAEDVRLGARLAELRFHSRFYREVMRREIIDPGTRSASRAETPTCSDTRRYRLDNE